MNHAQKIRRARFDGIYIFASVFAALGAFWLIGSYAFSKPQPTTTTGLYNLSDYAVNGTSGVYEMSLAASKEYCFSGKSLPSAVIVNPSSVSPETYSLAISEKYSCFTPTVAHDSVRLELLPSEAKPSQLLIR